MKNKLPILICFGTRPEWLKIKPLIKIMDRSEYKLFFTGQHEDLLKEVDVDYKATIGEGSNRLDEVVKGCLDLPKVNLEVLWFKVIPHLLSLVLLEHTIED